jgi:arylsulfatase A-like enzyme
MKLLISLLFLISISLFGADKKPNIIFLMADDLGVGDVGCYGYNDIIKTPHIDSIAKEGMRFTRTYTGSPVCGSSRCILLTGKHAGHARRRDNTTKDGKSKPDSLIPLAPEDITIAEMLKGAGYVTGGCGKWGVGNEGTTGTPDKQGFDHFYGYLDQVKAHSYYVDTLWKNGKQVAVERVGSKPRYSHDSMADDMLEFVKNNHKKPFFYYGAFCIPHDKFEVPDLDIYKDMKGLTPTEKIYCAMVTRMDKDIGRLLALLKELKIDDNTIVFFTSDNGPAKMWNNKFRSSGDQRGIKRAVYQGGINEPMVVRWPGKVPAGKVSDFQWVFYDVMPTFAAIAGITPPSVTDGMSVLPTLLGKEQKPHKFIYWEFYSGFQQAVIMGNMKAIRFGTKEKIQLFDISKDRKESSDLAEKYPEMVMEMAKIMDREHVEDPHWPSVEYKKKKSGKKKKNKNKKKR